MLQGNMAVSASHVVSVLGKQPTDRIKVQIASLLIFRLSSGCLEPKLNRHK
ncbi:hypothetical protein [Scytonema sp. NUACC21]